MGVIISSIEKSKYLPFIISNFDNMSQRKMARVLGIGKTTVNNWCKELGLRFKKHTVNEHFFDVFTEESAYILGFIFADGSISWNPLKGYYSLTITAAEKDKEHLEIIGRSMSSTKPLLYSEKTKSYRLIVNSKKLCKKLISLGVVPRKTKIVRFPSISFRFLKHFLRGVIDGDGTVRYLNRKVSPYFEISISSGSLYFCQGLVNAVRDAIGIKANIREAGLNTYIMQYSCYRGRKLAEFIYGNANIFLERKYLPYKNNVIGGRRK